MRSAERKYVADFAAKVVELFPKTPSKEAEAIAARACEKYSMRVGRSARAKALADDAITLAAVSGTCVACWPGTEDLSVGGAVMMEQLYHRLDSVVIS